MNNARIYDGNSTVTSGSRKQTLRSGQGSTHGTPTFDHDLTRNKSSLTMTRDDNMQFYQNAQLDPSSFGSQDAEDTQLLSVEVADDSVINNQNILMTTEISEKSFIYKVAGTMVEGLDNTEIS